MLRKWKTVEDFEMHGWMVALALMGDVKIGLEIGKYPCSFGSGKLTFGSGLGGKCKDKSSLRESRRFCRSTSCKAWKSCGSSGQSRDASRRIQCVQSPIQIRQSGGQKAGPDIQHLGLGRQIRPRYRRGKHIARSNLQEEVLLPLGLDFLTFLAATVLVIPIFKSVKASPVLGFLFTGLVLGQLGWDLLWFLLPFSCVLHQNHRTLSFTESSNCSSSTWLWFQACASDCSVAWNYIEEDH